MRHANVRRLLLGLTLLFALAAIAFALR